MIEDKPPKTAPDVTPHLLPETNFYGSSEYLAVAAEAYFNGRNTNVEYVEIGDNLFRLLVVDGRRVVTDLEFVDYHEPITTPIDVPVRRCGYAKSVVRGIVEVAAWDSTANVDLEPAPFVDWTGFATYEEYERFLKTRKKGLYNEQRRRRRRLAETFGELEFCAHDERSDVFELAVKWKTQQFHATGVRNYLADPRNVRHFELLGENGLLTSSTLRADGRLLSLWLGFMHDGVWSGWIFAYDPDPALRKYSVGQQLLHSMLEESFRREHREFDFSIGDEGYKWFFATHARVLGPVGRPPVSEQIKGSVRQAKRYAKGVLADQPELLERATSVGRVVRTRRIRFLERVQRLA